MTDINTQINKTNFLLTVDAILKKNKKLVLVKRKWKPEKGKWALPGGIIKINETAEDALKREVKEETGYECKPEKLIGVFDDPERDPRGRAISICFKCKAKQKITDKTTETTSVKAFEEKKLPELAFDHEKMIKKWKNSKNTDSNKK